ncbi:ribose-5-phosphate isomerase RpiA [Methanothermococcus sp.]|uniref:ribose-5-phosphate isomerase RpiA n=1 Tax=Methanothermococcus sp. TaxID=2614238 RepID=UPI0025EE43A9|nr:ribose-5-phosphate isomerase RpiA [Methanothermococcus sp.]
MAKSGLKSSSDVENTKFMVAKEAANLIKDGMIVGLGSGSTANLFIRELGRRVVEEELSIFGIPTSFESRMYAIQYGIPLVSLDEYGEIDIAIDGADEVDKKTLYLIKGGGGCHTREKIIDYCAKEFMVIVDENKIVDSLGDKTPVPLEVLPFAYSSVLNELLKRDTAPSIRMADRKMGPVITDNGNMIIDVFIELKNPEETEKELNNIPGVIENGIFTKVDKVLVGSPKKVITLKK